MVKNPSNKTQAAQRTKPSKGDFAGRCDLKLDGKCSTRSMLRRFAAVFFVCDSPTFCSFPAIGHFWVTKTLTFKTRLSAKPCFSVFQTLPGRCDLKLDGKCSTRSMLRRFSAVFFVCYSPTFCSFPAIGHFWVTKTFTFKTRLSAKPCFSVFELYLHENITEKVHIKKVSSS